MALASQYVEREQRAIDQLAAVAARKAQYLSEQRALMEEELARQRSYELDSQQNWMRPMGAGMMAGASLGMAAAPALAGTVIGAPLAPFAPIVGGAVGGLTGGIVGLSQATKVARAAGEKRPFLHALGAPARGNQPSTYEALIAGSGAMARGMGSLPKRYPSSPDFDLTSPGSTLPPTTPSYYQAGEAFKFSPPPAASQYGGYNPYAGPMYQNYQLAPAW